HQKIIHRKPRIYTDKFFLICVICDYLWPIIIGSKCRTNYSGQPLGFASSAFARAFLFALLDMDRWVIDDFNTAAKARKAKRTGPYFLAAANRYRQDRH